MRVEEMVGRRIRDARQTSGLSQEELGRELRSYLGKAWPGQQVSVAEDGGRKFSALELFALGSILARPASYFFIPFTADPIEVPGERQGVPAREAFALQLWGEEAAWGTGAPVVRAILETASSVLESTERGTRDARTSVGALIEALREGPEALEAIPKLPPASIKHEEVTGEEVVEPDIPVDHALLLKVQAGEMTLEDALRLSRNTERSLT